ncbi:MAG: hypothetical protein M3Q13_08255 [Pseudomonadota bacterium]|nr:hypothetical protein [Pseudomonadota bacterium]
MIPKVTINRLAGPRGIGAHFDPLRECLGKILGVWFVRAFHKDGSLFPVIRLSPV